MKTKNQSLSNKVINLLFGARVLAWSFLALALYGLQDLLHISVIPNTPLMYLTVVFYTCFCSNMIFGLVSYFTYTAYYFWHFIWLAYNYSFDKPTVTVVIFFCSPFILFFFYRLKRIIRRQDVQLNFYKKRDQDTINLLQLNINNLENSPNLRPMYSGTQAFTPDGVNLQTNDNIISNEGGNFTPESIAVTDEMARKRISRHLKRDKSRQQEKTNNET